jgi:hypothetical protein
MMRCDLHVHSWYSGRADLPVLGHVGRECYSHPEDVYEAATRRGMDPVTLTDHDGIEGALFLAGLRQGLTLPAGRSGTYRRLTSEVVRIFAAGYAEVVRGVLAGAVSPLPVAAGALLAPFLPLIPLFRIRRSGGCMTVLSYVTASDDRVTGRIVRCRPPRWVRLWMLWATRLGDGWLWLAGGLLLAAGSARGWRVLMGGAVAAGLANILLVLTKSQVHRSRPASVCAPPTSTWTR